MGIAHAVKLVVRFMSLSGDYRLVKTETFASTAAATAAVAAYAAPEGYTRVKAVDDHEDYDSIRFTATSPGGRAGRNVAYGDYENQEEI